jgi:hypothetical protein
MNPHKKPNDYMSQSAARSFGARDTMEVDAMIENEIRDLEKAAQADVRQQYGLDESVDLPLRRGASNNPRSGITLRDSLRSSFGGIGSLANSIEGLDNATANRQGSAGGVGRSIDTLGSTGIKALLMPELRLDGQKLDGDGDLDAFLHKYDLGGSSSGIAATTDAKENHHLSDPADDGILAGVRNDMTNLMATLTKDRPNMSQSMTFMDGVSPSGSMSGATKIPQITDYLHSEFNQFNKTVEQKDHFMDMSIKEQQIHDEKIREEGRADARSKGLFGLAHFSALAGSSPLDTQTSSDPDQPLTLSEEVKALDKFLGVDTQTLPVKKGIDLFAEAGSSGKTLKTTVKISTKELAPLQQAIDNEMGAADEVLYRMRSLRTGLGSRLKRLDALHAQVMNDKDSGIYVPPGASAQIPYPSSGTPPLPMYMQNLASNNNRYTTGSNSDGNTQGIALNNSSRSAYIPSPPTPFGTGADTAPPPLPEKLSVKMDNQTSNKVSHVTQNISSVLTITMEGMVNRLADNNKASELEQIRIPGSVPTIDPESIATTAENKAKMAPISDANAALIAMKATEKKLNDAVNEAAMKSGTSSSQDFGQTAQQLEQPDPPKSLTAQLDDMDFALGADHGPGAPIGLDQFLPSSVRAQNAMQLSQKYGSNVHPTSIEGNHAHGQAFAGKAKCHAPSALLSSHWAPPPTVFKVPVQDIPHAPVSPIVQPNATVQRVTVIAPTDEELWLQEIQFHNSGNHQIVSSAPAKSEIPSVPPLYEVKARQVPWKGDSGSYNNTYRQSHPLEGSAMRYNRDEISRINESAAQSAYALRVAEIASSSSATGTSNTTAVTSSTPLDAGMLERQQYLKKMQSIRQGMSAVW